MKLSKMLPACPLQYQNRRNLFWLGGMEWFHRGPGHMYCCVHFAACKGVEDEELWDWG